MPTKDPIKKAEANRARQARFRANKGVTQSEVKADVTPAAPVKPTGVTQADYDNLPPSLKFQVEAGTRTRQILKMPLQIEERKTQAVRRFRGY